MRIHLPGLPHNDTVRAAEYCAYAQKWRRLCDMLTGLGHDVFYYGGPENEGAVAEHVVVVTEQDRQRWFGDERYVERVFDRWDPGDPCWTEMNQAVIAAMRERVGPTDIVAVTMGRCQETIAQAFPNHVVCEPGIGYEGPLLTTHWCVESEVWRGFLYGKYGITDGRWFDLVAPNSFDPDDFVFRADHDGYLLFLGRMSPRKGLPIVAELAKHHRVITAGQGDERVPGAEHVGVVRGREKAELLAGARALICATQYIEPFGGVAVEAMLSGTPVIASPFGAFSETVAHGVTGYRCSTLGEFVGAADRVDDLDPKEVRAWAMGRYTLEVCAPQYDAWLERLGTLYGSGWYG